MTIMEQWSQKIPAYYNTMYLDGFTPAEILWAKRQAMWEEYDKRQEKKQEEKEQAMIEASIQKALDKTMKDLFKGWK